MSEPHRAHRIGRRGASRSGAPRLTVNWPARHVEAFPKLLGTRVQILLPPLFLNMRLVVDRKYAWLALAQSGFATYWRGLMAPDVHGTQPIAGDDHKPATKQIDPSVAIAGKYDPRYSLSASGIVIDPSVNAISDAAKHGPMLPYRGALGRLEHEREFRSRRQKGDKLLLRKPLHPQLCPG